MFTKFVVKRGENGGLRARAEVKAKCKDCGRYLPDCMSIEQPFISNNTISNYEARIENLQIYNCHNAVTTKVFRGLSRSPQSSQPSLSASKRTQGPLQPHGTPEGLWRSVKKESVFGIFNYPLHSLHQTVACNRAALYNCPPMCLNFIES